MPSDLPIPILLTVALTENHNGSESKIRCIRHLKMRNIRSFLFTHFSYSATSRPALRLGLLLFIGIKMKLDLLRIVI